MKLLFIYPHPDDESFGPAAIMHKMIREGHKVYLLTLTKGGATKQRHKYNYSVKKMGSVRVKEMKNMAKVLRLSGMTIHDLPDSGLKEMNPIEIENVVREEIMKIEPYVIVTYPVHGISGFHDHLVTHAVVKRVFEDIKAKKWFLKRLAFTTVDEKTAKMSKSIKLHFSTEEEIDCIVDADPVDIKATEDALNCYKTYEEVLGSSGIMKMIKRPYVFEFYKESFKEPVADLFDNMPAD